MPGVYNKSVQLPYYVSVISGHVYLVLINNVHHQARGKKKKLMTQV